MGRSLILFNKTELAYFRRRELGFIFQDFNLLPMLTVEENIVLPLTLDNQPVALMEERVKELAEKLGLMRCPNIKDQMNYRVVKHKE